MYSKEYLQEEYINKRRTRDDIMNEHLQKYGCRGDLQRALKKFGLITSKHRYKYTLNEDKIDLKYPEFAYYLGLILTDGYIHYARRYVSLCMTNKDAPTIFNKLKEFFEYTGKVNEYTYKSGDEIKPRWEFRITSDRLINYLQSIGVPQGPKSFTVKIPSTFPDDISASMFFRGIFDGDGFISGNRFGILKGSIPFIQGIVDFINSKWSKNYEVQFKQQKRGTYPILYLVREDSKNFLDWIYSSEYNYLSIDKKYRKYREVFY